MAPLHPWLLAPWELPRAAAELGGALALSPALIAVNRLRGTRAEPDPVLVVPGLWAGNAWTLGIRTHLSALGHDVRAPEARTMKAGRAAVVAALTAQLDRLVQAAGSPVGVVAWSIGGCFVRQVAAIRPALFRRLITLGTPLDGPLWYGRKPASRQLAVPVTALYSRTDGMIDWRRCVLPDKPGAENVEIVSSHLGMSTNPQALHVIADRLRR